MASLAKKWHISFGKEEIIWIKKCIQLLAFFKEPTVIKDYANLLPCMDDFSKQIVIHSQNQGNFEQNIQ